MTAKDHALLVAKNNICLFSRLFIACQAGEGNLKFFFLHENQAFPPSLSERGQLRSSKGKSKLIPCLLKNSSQRINEHPLVDRVLFDGRAIVNMLAPNKTGTFEDYAYDTFLPFVANRLASVKRLDIVWDCYFANSLKKTTRDIKGRGIRLKVTSNGRLPKDWKSFLRCDENKKELFPFLANTIVGKI